MFKRAAGYNGAMTAPVASLQAFERVLSEELRPPAYLTPEEVRGGWRQLFPELAACLPAPYPIFGTDEERIITFGYPILISEGIWRLRRELDRLVELETAHRLSGPVDGAGKDQVAAQRARGIAGREADDDGLAPIATEQIPERRNLEVGRVVGWAVGGRHPRPATVRGRPSYSRIHWSSGGGGRSSPAPRSRSPASWKRSGCNRFDRDIP